jgi:hypothetical protein
VASIAAPGSDSQDAVWWLCQSSGAFAREAKGDALAHLQKAVPAGCGARTSMSWRRSEHGDVAGKVNFSNRRAGLMTTNISKPRGQKLAKVINQMDDWMQHKTRLVLSIQTPLFNLFLRGRLVGRQERLFLFDSYGETCRVPVIPQDYDRVVCKQKGPASVTFESSETQGWLEIQEDGAKPMFEEISANWILSKIADDALNSDAAEQTTR